MDYSIKGRSCIKVDKAGQCEKRPEFKNTNYLQENQRNNRLFALFVCKQILQSNWMIRLCMQN